LFQFIMLCPTGTPDAAIPIAGSRAGALGVISLEFDPNAGLEQLRRLCTLGHGRCGALVDTEPLLELILGASLDGLDTIVLANMPVDRLSALVARVHGAGMQAYVVATRLEQALAAQAADADGVIAKGHEAGGWIGEEGSFVLSQRLIRAVQTPVFVHGGIGLHTVGAAYVAGAAGAVLDAQLLLARESPIPASLRATLAGFDGSQTATLGAQLGAPFRAHSRPGLKGLERLRDAEAQLAPGLGAPEEWRAAVRQHVAGQDPDVAGVLPLGQDAAFAADLAQRFGNVAGIVDGLRRAIADTCAALGRGNPLAQGAGVAQSHRTRYPLVQGPMTRVSDRAEFAAAVAQGGALPFLALALMRGPDADVLLARSAELIGEQPWGVGVLGFVPAELRAEQLEVVRRHRPPFALIAGGRPDQARELEADGIATYLHVPSPQLLRLYIKDGARRFVFEGRECGGHVGPRTSFVLWDTMLRVLLEELPSDACDCDVLLAGGIHDAKSAAMAAAAGAVAAERGARIGALMGTSYLFTREATECGAITPLFQQAALAAVDTALLESGPGHATRCLPSPFVKQFAAERLRLRAAGLDAEELRGRLEQLNIGRLRIASKGVDRASSGEEQPQAAEPARDDTPSPPPSSQLVAVDADAQWEQGMYMIGQIAALRDAVTTVADLHRDVSQGSTELLAGLSAPEPAADPPAPPTADVAIVGLGCILPGAPDVATLWANIVDKVDAIGEVPPERWDWRRMYDPDPSARDKVYSRWGGFIDPVPLDPMALGLPPKSLESIEPFQLLALLCAQKALKDAGYATRPFDRERTSVILGAGGGGADTSVGYTVRSALPSLLGDAHPQLQEQLFEHLPEWTEDSFAGILMNVAAGRIANRLDFGGTNYTVDAACASSLSAIGLAARELQMGTSDMVLAGGVDAIQNPFAYLCFAKTHALSPAGHCRPFDAAADGIAISEGFATIVLKRLADAERDGDRIYAVIRGVGAASDGRDRSLTAPRPEGQMRALRRAYAQARVSPETVTLVEAHGTGTVAGDGAEIKALSTVFREHSEQRQWCAVGSVKSMIGHTKATAGVAGVVKAALALHHRVLPPTIGVSEPNPKADFPNSPFYVNSEARPWLSSAAGHPRRAGVSAFGFGGTDFHLVLEEYTGAYLQEQDTAVPRWPGELLLWHGCKDEVTADLDAFAARLTKDDLQLDVLAHEHALATAKHQSAGPTLALVATSLEDLRAKLTRARELLASGQTRVHDRDGIYWSEQPLSAEGSVAFLFPGQGSQTLDMGRELAMAFPQAREQLELADRVLAGLYERPLSSYVFPPPSFTPQERRHRQAELTDTHVAQAAIGASELAYLRVFAALGIEPAMTAGHSYGEFAALAAAGGIDAEQLLLISEARGRFMKEAAKAEAGAMVAVDAPPDALTQLLEGGGVVTANLNSPRQTVLSGPREHVEAAEEWCRARDIGARMLPVACAFHSPHVAGAQQRLAQLLQDTTLTAPTIPIYSNTTGDVHTDQPSAIAQVLSEHLTRPVEFVREIEAMYRDGARVFVEVGPRSVLTGLVGQILGEREHIAVSADRSGRSGLLSLLHCLGALAAEGVPVNVQRLFCGRAELDDQPGNGRAEPRPGPAWLVDGGRAWPAGTPRVPATPIPVTDTKEQTTMITTSTNGDGALAPAATQEHRLTLADLQPDRSPPSANEILAPPPSAGEISGSPLAGDRVADVVLRHQQVMQQFLETQRSVMLGYLGAAQGALPARPSVAMPRRAVPALPVAPAPAATPLAVPASTAPAPVQPVSAPAQPVTAAAAPVPVPAPEAAAPAPTQPANGATTLTPAEIEERLLALVSDRTGYPADMLGLDADLEGDLGIDSIKRVEIAGTFTQSLPEADRGAIDIEELTASKTLRAVIDTLVAAIAGPASGAGAAPPGAQDVLEEQRPFRQGPAEQERIGRFVVHAASAPTITATAGLAAAGAVVIIDDERGVGEALATALTDQGHHVVRLARDAQPQDAQQAAQLAAQIRDDHGGAKALVHLAALGDPQPQYGGLTGLLALAQALREDLEAATTAGGAVVLGATRLGGAFGVGGTSVAGAATQGALHGFLKTLAQEWPTVRVKSVDLSDTSPAQTAEQLLAELMAADGLVEVGYHHRERTQLALAPAPLAERPAGEILDGDCVLLVTGGARGITARVALTLAERYRPTLVLVGRTELQEESPESAALGELAQLRQAMIETRRREHRELTPALVEQDCRRILQAREVRENLERLRQTGARVEYVVCDVSDQDAFAGLIDSVYERHGRIDGAVHGAGVIEDKLIADKQPDSLARVMSTKAAAAQTLADRLRPDGLRFLVLFSSVSGRFGNRGQADYAAASEVLGKLAHELDSRWPGRVVSVDWGPWRTAGMVSPLLEQEFARRGVALIGLDQGARMLDDELTRGHKGETEVVIGAATGLAGADGSASAAANPASAVSADPAGAGALALIAGASEVVRLTDDTQGQGTTRALYTLDLQRDRYLDDHRIDGRPVLPFAAAMELMAQVAAATTPGLALAGLRDIRLLDGIALEDDQPVSVCIDATPRAGGEEVAVTINPPDGGRSHYRALVELRDPAEPHETAGHYTPRFAGGRTDTATHAAPTAIADLKPFPMPIEAAYRDLLFHGPLFQGIVAIDGMDERGSSALLRPSRPGRCVAGADELSWLLDPVLLDSALQIQVLWARLQWDVTLLPAGIGGYARLAAPDEGELVRHELRIRPASSAPLCHADHWFYGSDGRLLALLEDVVGVGTQTLNRLAGARP
jgi:acyl transferase domain-containing protein/NAD(P)H-dependent flavin oxidoreductase YrpB (nitropropane dioxygenase family)/NAD(P)-dependent dehydrogenase (short-subunit alcohol dehydrogenase family)